MKKISEYKWHDRRKIEFDLDDNDGGYNRYEVDVDFWFIDDPEVNFKSVDEIYINSLIKDGEEVNFTKQSEIKKEIKDAVINYLEREI